LLAMQSALLALQNNQVEPILRPVPHRGRANSSVRRAALMGIAAGTVRRLCEAGYDPADAHQRVARHLKKLGVRPERGNTPLSATTIRHWCDKVAEDVSRLGPAAIVYDDMFTPDENARFAQLQKHEAQKFALASLAGFVQTNFPELASS
jgi:hypothetical protein